MKAKQALAIAGVVFITPLPYITLPVAALAALAARSIIYCCERKKHFQGDCAELPNKDARDDDEPQPSYEASLTSFSPDGSKLFIFEPNRPSPAKALGTAAIINGTIGCNLILLSEALGGSILGIISSPVSCLVSCLILSRIIKAHLEEGVHKFRIIGSYNLSDQASESDAYHTDEMLHSGESADIV